MERDYTYQFLSVPGGGFVTGFLFHPSQKDILYCRTDIGGVYRYDFNGRKWMSLVDNIKDTEKWKTYPLSIAVDNQHPNILYMAVGLKPHSAIGFSEDFGNTFSYIDTPVADVKGTKVEVHGNAPGRSTGERLIVDPLNCDVLYLGTMGDGLYITTHRCKSWEKLVVGPFDEKNITFVSIDERAGSLDGRCKRIVVGTTGQWGSPDGNIRGMSVYISEDGGKHFKALVGQPEPIIAGPVDHPGYVAQQIDYDDKYMYITYSAYNVGWSTWNTVGCDTGKCYDGALFRYSINENGEITEALDITPIHPFEPDYKHDSAPGRRLGYGLSGVCTDRNNPGTLIMTTIAKDPDVIYRSVDYGKNFTPIMTGLKIGNINFHTNYQKPEYNGNDSLVHWMSCIKINPFDSDMALFNTGAGIFATFNLTQNDIGKDVVFETFNEGVEETVHLNVYAPPNGEIRVIDVIGDYGMFLFKNLETVPENTVADENNNRWITAMNADFADHSGRVIVATMRGNWKGKTKGGLVMTRDGGKSFSKLPDPKPINQEIDRAIAFLKHPNVTSGWVALSADEKHLVWAIGLPLNGDMVLYSHDYGNSYGKTIFFNTQDEEIRFDKPVKIFSDRVTANRFYGFADMEDGPAFFVSRDYGESFKLIRGPIGFPNQLLAGIDSQQDIEIRGIPGREGEFYFAMQQDGLWLIRYDEPQNCFIGTKVSKEGDFIKRIGIGVGEEGLMNLLYTSGTIDHEYGFFLSKNGGFNWERINDDQHQYGDIRSIDGDKRVPGLFYIATGTRGLIYGKPVE